MRSATAWVGETLIASSDDVVVVEGFAYFPSEAITPGLLAQTRNKSLCLWKGVASYYDITVGDANLRSAAWTYHHPSPVARRVKNRKGLPG
jgi:uncharacterized protein (DUF427 family)